MIPGRGCSWAKKKKKKKRCWIRTPGRYVKLYSGYLRKKMAKSSRLSSSQCSAGKVPFGHIALDHSQNWLLDDSFRPREWDALILQRLNTIRVSVGGQSLAVNLHLKSQRSPWLLTKSWLLLYIYTYVCLDWDWHCGSSIHCLLIFVIYHYIISTFHWINPFPHFRQRHPPFNETMV